MCQTVFPPHTSAILVPKTIIIVLITHVILTSSITVNKLGRSDIVAKRRIELRPLTLNCFLNDVVRVSAPMINEEEAFYYLHKPSGEAMELKLGQPKLFEDPTAYLKEASSIVSKFVKNVNPIITQSNNYDIFSMRKLSVQKFSAKLKELDPNDFMLGPLVMEDFGNWVLSVYTKDLKGEWIELYQVISVTITEYVPADPVKPTLKTGDTFKLGFAFPVSGLQSCELVAPRSTFDRFYERDLIEADTCGYLVPNITPFDKGLWRIIGVGHIVYEAEVYLNVNSSFDNKKI